MTELPANPIRGIYAIISIICMAAGFWLLWGFAASLAIMGTFCAIDASLDESIERFTKTKRAMSLTQADQKT